MTISPRTLRVGLRRRRISRSVTFVSCSSYLVLDEVYETLRGLLSSDSSKTSSSVIDLNWLFKQKESLAKANSDAILKKSKVDASTQTESSPPVADFSQGRLYSSLIRSCFSCPSFCASFEWSYPVGSAPRNRFVGRC